MSEGTAPHREASAESGALPPELASLEVAVVGCGAIGGVVAAQLSRRGMRVTPVTGNGTIAEALSSQGYRVRDFEGDEWSTPVTAQPVIDPAEVPPQRPLDVVVLATQATRMLAALEAIAPRLAPDAIVVCCQNGIPEDRAARVVGRERVLGSVVGWGASMVEPGRYKRTSRGGLQLGVPWHGTSEPPSTTARRAAALLDHAAPARLVDNFVGVRWSKLAINSVTSTFGAIGGKALGALLRHRFTRRLALEVFTEVAALSEAAGVRMTPVGGTFEIDKLALSAAERGARLGSPSLLYKHTILVAVGVKYRRMRSSMLYALERGRPPEIDFLNGELLERAADLGIDVPVNRALVAAVKAIEAGDATPSVEGLRAVYDRVVGR